MVGVDRRLYGFLASKKELFCAIFCTHFKFFICHCTGYLYFKDSSMVYLDLFCFNMTGPLRKAFILSG